MNTTRTTSTAPRALTTLAAAGAALSAAALASAEDMVALSTTPAGQALVGLDSDNPVTPTSTTPITGVHDGFTITGIDFRPSDGRLYGIGTRVNDPGDPIISRLYTIDMDTGEATAVGGDVDPGIVVEDGDEDTLVGMDFNPVVDLIRVITSLDQNTVIDPDTGLIVATATSVFYADGDRFEGVDPFVADIAYTNSTPCATATQQYGIDTEQDILVTVANSAGTLETVGDLDIEGPIGLSTDVMGAGGLDVSGDTETVYALLTVGLLDALGLPVDVPLQSLYTINTATGEATSLGLAGTGLLGLSGLTVIPDSFPCCDSRADIDMDGELTLFDFLAYQNLFDAGDDRADFDGDGSLTLFDFLAFQNEFDMGC
ncbi:MAG: DUF4394 domain-containing protein [Phycisphaerales bacterium JB060]